MSNPNSPSQSTETDLSQTVSDILSGVSSEDMQDFIQMYPRFTPEEIELNNTNQALFIKRQQDKKARVMSFKQPNVDIVNRPLNVLHPSLSSALLKWQMRQWGDRFKKKHSEDAKSLEHVEEGILPFEKEDSFNQRVSVYPSSPPLSFLKKTGIFGLSTAALAVPVTALGYAWPTLMAAGISSVWIASKTNHLLSRLKKSKADSPDVKGSFESFSNCCKELAIDIKSNDFLNMAHGAAVGYTLIHHVTRRLVHRLPTGKKQNSWVNNLTISLAKKENWMLNAVEKWRISARLKLLKSHHPESSAPLLYAKVSDLYHCMRWLFIQEQAELFKSKKNAEYPDPETLLSKKEFESMMTFEDPLSEEYGLDAYGLNKQEIMLDFLNQYLQEASLPSGQPWFKPHPQLPSLIQMLEACVTSVRNLQIDIGISVPPPDYSNQIAGLKTMCEAEEIRAVVGSLGPLSRDTFEIIEKSTPVMQKRNRL